MIVCVVEGDTDIPFVEKILDKVGLAPVLPLVDAGGKHNIDKNLPGYAAAAKGSPYLVLRDLDNDAPCAAKWVEDNLPPERGKFFCLRLAVREVESWFMADSKATARALHVSEMLVPIDPDLELDPTATLVRLASRSTKPAIKRGLIPGTGESRMVGPDYERWLIDAGRSYWDIDRALLRSGSLRKALKALDRLRALWSVVESGQA